MKTILRIAVLAFCLSPLAGCKPKEAAPVAVAPPPLKIKVLTLKARSVPIDYQFVGQTQASKSVEIRARIQGFLAPWTFHEGSKVEVGQLIYQIDPREYESEVESARAAVELAEANQTLAERELARIKPLVLNNAATKRELDNAQSNLDISRAQIRNAKAVLARAELNLSYTKITSPIRGLIGRSMMYEGALVDSGQNSLLNKVLQIDPIYVYFSIAEREMLEWRRDVAENRIQLVDGADSASKTVKAFQQGSIKEDSPMSLRLRLTLIDGTVYDQEGRLNFGDVQVNPQTGTMLVRGEFPNTQEKLKPGQFVKASIIGWEAPAAIAVPQSAVIQNPTGHFVYAVDDQNRIEMRRVTPAGWASSQWIVRQGLKAGDRVAIEGLLKLQPVAVIQPVEVDSEQAIGPAADAQRGAR